MVGQGGCVKLGAHCGGGGGNLVVADFLVLAVQLRLGLGLSLDLVVLVVLHEDGRVVEATSGPEVTDEAENEDEKGEAVRVCGRPHE